MGTFQQLPCWGLFLHPEEADPRCHMGALCHQAGLWGGFLCRVPGGSWGVMCGVCRGIRIRRWDSSVLAAEHWEIHLFSSSWRHVGLVLLICILTVISVGICCPAPVPGLNSCFSVPSLGCKGSSVLSRLCWNVVGSDFPGGWGLMGAHCALLCLSVCVALPCAQCWASHPLCTHPL